MPRRNRHGLSFVTHTLKAPSIERIQIQLGQQPLVARIDWIQMRLWAQGSSEPHVLRLQDASGLARLDRVNMLFLAPNVFASTAPHALLRFSCAQVTRAVVFRVDVEIAFTSFATSVVPSRLGGPEARLRQMREPVSRQITRTIRVVKRLAR